jgi:predicted Zn-dependent protease
MNTLESFFLELTAPFAKTDPDREAITISLVGEDTTFIRFNGAKVRQAGEVRDRTLYLNHQLRAKPGTGDGAEEIREASGSVTLTGDLGEDRLRIRHTLDRLKALAAQGAPKPFATWPQGGANSSVTTKSPGLPSASEWSHWILPAVADLDFTGILTSGRVYRASRNSLGLSHWFEAESATLDYSLISPVGRAVKSEFATSGAIVPQDWQETFRQRIARERTLLEVLKRPERRLKAGDLRCYLGPSAVQDLVQMLSWGAVSEDAIRQGTSPLKHLRHPDPSKPLGFSPLFRLSEDFERNPVPRFNHRGEVAPLQLPLIEGGKLLNTWINSETAKEYGLVANGANDGESLRAPVLAAGDLPEADALKQLGTGVFLPNLHYLNWSDQPSGRITGMTRHACVWVEDGRPVAPIENLRWDDTLFRVFGSELEALTREQTAIPETGSYEHRGIGGSIVPGALLRSFRFVA